MDALMANNRALTSWAATRSKSPYKPEWTVLILKAEKGNLRHTFDAFVLNRGGSIDWGDGTSNTSNTHTYAAPGEYTVIIDNLHRFGFDNENLIYEAIQCGITVGNAKYMFNNSKKLHKIHSTFILHSGIMDIQTFAAGTVSLLELPESFRISESVANAPSSFRYSGIKNSPVIASYSGAKALWDQAFIQCHGLRKINVEFDSWDKIISNNWVTGVSPTGDFYCPADLPLIWDDSHIPVGWTAHPEGKDPVPYPG